MKIDQWWHRQRQYLRHQNKGGNNNNTFTSFQDISLMSVYTDSNSEHRFKKVKMYVLSNISDTKKKETQDFGFGSDAPFLRATSTNDIFKDMEQNLGLYFLIIDVSGFDWPKIDDNNPDSYHSTLVSTQYEDHYNKNHQWAFSNDSSTPTFHQDSYASLFETTMGHEGYPEFGNGKYEDSDYKNGTVLETMQLIGTSAFSTSFLEKIIEEGRLDSEERLKLNLAPSTNPYYVPEGVQWVQPNLSQYWESGAQMSSASLTQSLNSSATLNYAERSASPEKKQKYVSPNNESSSNRRKTLQFNIQCNECICDLGIAFVRGSSFNESDNPLNVNCSRCVGITPKSLNQDVTDKKKRKKESKCMNCEVCHMKIGNGGVEARDGDDIKVEYVCSDCGDKYMFCSECGGGGKQRTGKWRPKELFEQGRRTCSLPHIRVGTAEINYKVIRAADLTADILQGIQDVFFDYLLSLYCVPSIMTNHKYGSFEAVKRDIERLWLTSVLDVLTNKVLQGEKYITVAWIHKRHRNKGAGRATPSKETVPWLQRLNLQGIIPPSLSNDVDSEEKHHCFVAFSIAEWDSVNQSIFLAQIAPRSVFLKTMDGYMELIRSVIEQIKKDAMQVRGPTPQHIWCWAKADHARLQSIPARLKFIPKQDYLSLHPSLDHNSLERPDYEPVNLDETNVYAASVKNFVNKK